MQLHFEPDLQHQKEAIAAVRDLFRGQETCRTEFTVVHSVEQGDAFSRPLRLHALHTVVLDVRYLQGYEMLLQQVAAHAPVVCARRVSNAALLTILRSVGDPFPRLEALTLAGDVSTSAAVVLAGLVPRLASLLPPLPCARPITAAQE